MKPAQWSILVLILLFCTGCELQARPPLIVHVLGPKEKVPYRMNNELYTAEKLKQDLSATAKEFPYEFAESRGHGDGMLGLIVYPEKDASFIAVMQLLQLLKECNVTAYSIATNYKPDSKILVGLSLPVYSANLEVTQTELGPEPPKDTDNPQQRIQEIAEKMGGLRRK